jgi:hypothetical protein
VVATVLTTTLCVLSCSGDPPKSSTPSLLPPSHKKFLSDFAGHVVEWKYSRDELLKLVDGTGLWQNETFLTQNERNFTRLKLQGARPSR